MKEARYLAELLRPSWRPAQVRKPTEPIILQPGQDSSHVEAVRVKTRRESKSRF
jgi:hypothetical protein